MHDPTPLERKRIDLYQFLCDAARQLKAYNDRPKHENLTREYFRLLKYHPDAKG